MRQIEEMFTADFTQFRNIQCLEAAYVDVGTVKRSAPESIMYKLSQNKNGPKHQCEYTMDFLIGINFFSQKYKKYNFE